MTVNRRISGPSRLVVSLRVLVLAGVLVTVTRGLGGLVVGTVAPAATAWRTAGMHGLATLPPDRAVTGVAVLALAGCWLWLLATAVPFTARTTLALLRSTRVTHAPGQASLRGAGRTGHAPRLVRLCVLLALGGPGLLVAGPAGAVQRPAPSALPPSSAAPVLDGLPLPERVDAPAATGPATPGRTRAPRVLVRAGDSLWRIAATRMTRPDAGTAAVARAAERLRAANRTRLGPDPDLIFPGTYLVLPNAAPDREDHR